MERKLVIIGNSQGIVLPKNILKLMGWEGMYYLEIDKVGKELILSLPKTQRKFKNSQI